MIPMLWTPCIVEQSNIANEIIDLENVGHDFQSYILNFILRDTIYCYPHFTSLSYDCSFGY